jgi:hypothetical protein
MNHLNQSQDVKEITKILDHQWAPLSGKLMLKVQRYTDEESLIEADILKEDNPMLLAKYILEHPVEKTRSGFWNTWAKDMVKSVNKTLRRLRSMYELDQVTINIGDLPFRKARRVCRRKKKKLNFGSMAIKFGVDVPRTVDEALALDKKNGDNKWAESIQKEMQGLYDHETFKFLEPNVSAPKGY